MSTSPPTVPEGTGAESADTAADASTEYLVLRFMLYMYKVIFTDLLYVISREVVVLFQHADETGFWSSILDPAEKIGRIWILFLVGQCATAWSFLCLLLRFHGADCAIFSVFRSVTKLF